LSVELYSIETEFETKIEFETLSKFIVKAAVDFLFLWFT